MGSTRTLNLNFFLCFVNHLRIKISKKKEPKLLKVLLLIEIAPRLAAHEVAAIVARRPRPTPAAFILITTSAAIPAIVKRPERL